LKTMVLLGLVLASSATAKVVFSGVHSPLDGPVRLRITMRVVNPAVVPVKSLAQAERIAGHILSNAGVEVIWVDCANPPGCAQDRGPVDFWLHVITGSPNNLHNDATGFAVLTPHWRDSEEYAGVSYSVVEAASKSLDVEVSYILGATLAHEIGHLFLGALSHSRGGVMSPRLRQEQLRMAARGELMFTPEQASRFRAEILRRMAR